MELDEAQSSARKQFARQSNCYGKGHILSDVNDVAAAVKKTGLKSGAAALDVATGAGHTAVYLAGQGFQVSAADVAQEMLDRTGEAAAEHGVEIDLHQHVAEDFPYPNESFDLVSCRVAGHHFSSPRDFVKESERVLKPGGWLLVIDGSIPDGEPAAEAWTHEVEKLRDPSHGRFLRQGEWNDLCRDAGLRVEFSELQPMKMPDLEWYFTAAATSEENREKVRELVSRVPEEARSLFRVSEEKGKIVWWWQRLTLLARKGS